MHAKHPLSHWNTSKLMLVYNYNSEFHRNTRIRCAWIVFMSANQRKKRVVWYNVIARALVESCSSIKRCFFITLSSVIHSCVLRVQHFFVALEQ